MKAARKVKVVEPKKEKWQSPIDISKYNRSPYLTKTEKEEIRLVIKKTTNWHQKTCKILDRLLQPLNDAIDIFNPDIARRSPIIRVLLKEINKRQTTYWDWKEEDWAEIIDCPNSIFNKKYGVYSGIQVNLAAVIYLLFELDFHCTDDCRLPSYLVATKVFGKELIQQACEKITRAYLALGYSKTKQEKKIRAAISDLLLANRSPYIEDITIDILQDLRENQNIPSYIKTELSSISLVLLNMGIISEPLNVVIKDGEFFGNEDARKNVSPEWFKWCQRWYNTSTLSLRTQQKTYYDVLKVGRWLTHKHPEINSPEQWTRQLAIEFIAEVNQMKIGDYVENINRNCDQQGKPLTPVTKSGFISSVRRFFQDCQEWDWISRKFSPDRALVTPRSIRALIKPNPRVIADDIWAKLLWAGLNLKEEDLPLTGISKYPYPLALVQAVTITWLLAGIRNNEIIRLRVGCIRWQKDDVIISGTNEIVSKDAICYLEIPVNKTSPGYTKPVDRVLGEAIEAWKRVRPAQSPLIDKKDGRLVDFLFMYRGRKIGNLFINDSIIPLLCKKAGIASKDVKGKITSHRARSTIATQLSTAKDPMTLFELKEWLGHSDINSTINYAKVTPTKLAKSYQDAEYFKRNLRNIEVLIDQDAITTGAVTNGEPWKYYDLGHGLCTYDFFSQCKHRMACAGCGFYIPKNSSKAQIIEAKGNLERMLQEIPLTEEEQLAVTEGIETLTKLKQKLANVPTPSGQTPKQLEEERKNA
ncbi:tyrosine-type recombinase/integrase [Iningainema tapete]|uniref:Site-specific integrase n=1 Tax=Iningainema tapete BLCC-T55 TaxID=2748662 RepID=A0A8J7CBD9_9CYAN|nr:site-specific integrase [Iningainema tapete]MBD2778246.1 site-specific integrase [Iningainema tapete BLCC-T55]